MNSECLFQIIVFSEVPFDSLFKFSSAIVLGQMGPPAVFVAHRFLHLNVTSDVFNKRKRKTRKEKCGIDVDIGSLLLQEPFFKQL